MCVSRVQGFIAYSPWAPPVSNVLCSRSRACIRHGPDKPQPRVVRHYVNLTNGIEGLNALSSFVPANEVRFTRIQSSHAEAGAYDKILRELDHDLLWSLANGHCCYLYDFASRNPLAGVPRSIFLGSEFVKWALLVLWFGLDDPRIPGSVMVRGKDVVRFWRESVIPFQITKETKKRIRYYRPFAIAADIRCADLRAVYGRSSSIDGKKDTHVAVARAWLKAEYGSWDIALEEVDSERTISDASRTQDDIGHQATMQTWMRDWRLAEFDSSIDPDELRRVQAWMQEAPPIWTRAPEP